MLHKVSRPPTVYRVDLWRKLELLGIQRILVEDSIPSARARSIVEDPHVNQTGCGSRTLSRQCFMSILLDYPYLVPLRNPGGIQGYVHVKTEQLRGFARSLFSSTGARGSLGQARLPRLDAWKLAASKFGTCSSDAPRTTRWESRRVQRPLVQL